MSLKKDAKTDSVRNEEGYYYRNIIKDFFLLFLLNRKGDHLN